MALCLALLDTDSKKEYNKLGKEKKKQVQKKLYEALYSIIAYTDLEQHVEPNQAIGQVLAKAIKGHTISLTRKDRIRVGKLAESLRKVVTGAIQAESEAAQAGPQATSEASALSLYARLGGYAAIAKVTDTLRTKLFTDPQIGAYWKGQSNDSRQRGRELVIDFLCRILGGPDIYTGRDMKTAHEGLGISNDNWDAFMEHMQETLTELQVPSEVLEGILKVIASLKEQIVER